MKTLVNTLCSIAAASCLLIMSAGCENSELQTSEGPDVSGSWSGEYRNPEGSDPITAEIVDSGGSVTIQTSRNGIGHTLVGRWSDGDLAMVDLYDGETWTSFGDISANHIWIRDYVPPIGSGAEQDIILNR